MGRLWVLLVVVLAALAPGETAWAGHVPVARVGETCAGQPATVIGTDAGEELVGTSGPDVIWAGAGGDEIFALGGDDIVCGGEGADEISDGAGAGADQIYGEGGADQIYSQGLDLIEGGPGNDFIQARGQDLLPGETGALLGGDGRDFVLLGAADEGLVVDVPAGTVRGGASYDISGLEGFSLTSFRDVFRGGPADEQVMRTEGGDDLSLGGGDDFVELTSTPPSRSEVRMGSGDDRVLASGPGGSRLWLGAGDDTARFQAAITVYAGPGDDRIEPVGAGLLRWDARGEAGRDLVSFEYMNFRVRLDARAGSLSTNGRGHRLGGFETYLGTRFGDELLGTDGRDRIRGLGGADIIRGRAGNDVLLGDEGVERIRGGAGRDLCSRGQSTGCERLT